MVKYRDIRCVGDSCVLSDMATEACITPKSGLVKSEANYIVPLRKYKKRRPTGKRRRKPLKGGKRKKRFIPKASLYGSGRRRVSKKRRRRR